MNADRLLALYDRVVDAPDAVGRLRRFVLGLAVRGRLVEPHSEDEPVATVLADRGVRVSDSQAFETPATWAWVSAGTVAESRLGKMLDKSKNTGASRRYLRNVNVRWFDFDLSDVLEMRFEDAELPKFALRHGDVLICEGGEPGRAAVWDGREDDIYFQKAIHRLRFLDIVDGEYFVKALRASADDGRLVQYFTGTTIKHFTGTALRAYLFPLPPLTEQRRIVKRVDELMALCDQLAEGHTACEDRRTRLTKASYARLSASEIDSSTFQSHAPFAVDAFPELTARANQVKHLRQTILNLAVRGKLVAQNAADEPASEVLKRIAMERKQLSKTRRVSRARKPSDSPASTELDLGLPCGWTSTRLSEIVTELQTGPFGSSLHKSDYRIGGTPVINPASIRHGKIVPVENMAVGNRTLERLSTFKLRAGDIVMARRGEMGRCAVVDDRADGWLCGTGSLILRLPDCLYPEYLAMVMGSPDVRKYLQGSSVGSTMRNLNQSILLAMSIGLPPLAEQHRIVAKVDELGSFCNRLEVGLVAAESTRGRLLERILYDALAPMRPRRMAGGDLGGVNGAEECKVGTPPSAGPEDRGASQVRPSEAVSGEQCG